MSNVQVVQPASPAPETQKLVEEGVVVLDELTPCTAMCCCVDSFYCKYPQCCGCYTSSVLLCFQIEAFACKPAVKEGECCICFNGQAVMIWPTTFCKGVTQCFCIDHRCAFPCDNDVPCMFGTCGLLCCFNFKTPCTCCVNVKDIKAATGQA